MKVLLLCLFAVSASALPARTPWVRGGGRIVGGEEATPGQFPYQLSFTSFDFHFCAASILDETTAITAAHCVDGGGTLGLEIVAGQHSISQDDGTEQTIGVASITVHESYGSPVNSENDIALLKLDGAIEFNEYAQPVVLPSQDQDTTVATCTVSGWGTLASGGSSPDILQYVEVPVVSDADCRSSYGQNSIADSMICAGEQGKDSCQGDSGGPMYCGGYLGGVVSWGVGCALENFPGVYTEVSYFVDWIAANQ